MDTKDSYSESMQTGMPDQKLYAGAVQDDASLDGLEGLESAAAALLEEMHLDMRSRQVDIDLEVEKDDDGDLDGGSPTRVAWKYAWGGTSAASARSGGAGLNSATSVGPAKGHAASDRLYREAAAQRAAREMKARDAQRAALRAQAKPDGAKKGEHAAHAERFKRVLATSAAGRYRNEIVAMAAVRGGKGECERARDAYNYGDLLFQEGRLQAQRREEARQRELREREARETKCTFQPEVSSMAKQLLGPRSSWPPSTGSVCRC